MHCSFLYCTFSYHIYLYFPLRLSFWLCLCFFIYFPISLSLSPFVCPSFFLYKFISLLACLSFSFFQFEVLYNYIHTFSFFFVKFLSSLFSSIFLPSSSNLKYFPLLWDNTLDFQSPCRNKNIVQKILISLTHTSTYLAASNHGNWIKNFTFPN